MPALTAIMPTSNRRLAFLPLSIGRLAKQSVDTELIVVSEDLEALETAKLQMTKEGILGEAVLCPKNLTIGAKRNIACAAATSEWITHWDDDDWSRENRLALTLSKIAQNADIVGSSTMLVHELVDSRRRTSVYKYKKREDDDSYPEDYLIGGLLTYKAALWKRLPFDEQELTGEETWWQFKVIKGGARIAKMLEDPTLYVSMLHGKNTAYTGTAIPSGDPTMLPWVGDLRSLMGEDLLSWEAAAKKATLADGVK